MLHVCTVRFADPARRWREGDTRHWNHNTASTRLQSRIWGIAINTRNLYHRELEIFTPNLGVGPWCPNRVSVFEGHATKVCFNKIVRHLICSYSKHVNKNVVKSNRFRAEDNAYGTQVYGHLELEPVEELEGGGCAGPIQNLAQLVEEGHTAEYLEP